MAVTREGYDHFISSNSVCGIFFCRELRYIPIQRGKPGRVILLLRITPEFELPLNLSSVG
jgi:hypothetical protein